MQSMLFLVFIVGVIFLVLIAATIVIVITITRSKKQQNELNSFESMTFNLTKSNNEVKAELSELKEKVNNIENKLKDS